MTNIIRIDEAKQRAETSTIVSEQCPHKEATVYTRARAVCCSFCGAELDPFDVLVDLVQTSPAPDNGKEQQKYIKEVQHREKEK